MIISIRVLRGLNADFLIGGSNEKIEFIDLLEKVKEYSQTEKKMIAKAYQYAKDLHQGQYRQSGEPYVMHPLTVAYILADMHADCDTICAGLLHDTLEDTKITKVVLV